MGVRTLRQPSGASETRGFRNAPAVDRPREAILSASLHIGGTEACNAWPLWFFPANPWASVAGVALLAPLGRLHELTRGAPKLTHFGDPHLAPSVVIATMWTAALDAYVQTGGRAVLLQSGADPEGPLPTIELPFWREALPLCEAHPAWGDFPHAGCAGLQFFGCAPDYALDTANHDVRPILRRLDTRTMAVHDYACELAWNQGRMILTTLRIEGGQGTQPLGISRNTAAAYLLRCWLRYLQSTDA